MRALLAFSVCFVVGCPVPPPGDVTREGEGETAEGEGEGATEGEGETFTPSCLPDDNTGFPLPRDDRTDPVGSSSTFEIGAWNLAHFGNPDESGPRQTELAADIITSLALDLIAVEEIESETEFNELLKRLPEHEGVLGPSTGNDEGFDQRTGFIYRCGRLSPGPSISLFSGNFNFPRAPLQVQFHYDDGATAFDFIAIVVHLKAFSDPESDERRRQAFVLLQNYVDSVVNSGNAPDEVVVLGDFNERLDNTAGQRNWAPFLDTSKYVVRTQPLSDRGESSFISNSNAILDHIVTTRGFDDEVGAGTIVIPRVDDDVPNYRDDVSDHRPVALVLRGF